MAQSTRHIEPLLPGSVPAPVPLDAASAQSSATLNLTAQTVVPLDAASAVSSATLDLYAPGPAMLLFDASSGLSSAALGVAAPAIFPAHALYAPSVLALNPLYYWRLGELSGTNANDETANNRDGTYSASGITYSQTGALAGDADTAVDLDGGATSIITGAYGVYAAGVTRTFIGWANRDTSVNQMALMSSSVTSASRTFLSLAAGSNDVGWSPHITNAPTQTWTGAWPGDDQWVFWALVCVDNGASTTAQLYINGSLVTGTKTYGAGWAAGNVRYGARAANLVPFDGMMDELAAFDGDLGATAIAALYSSGITSQPGLNPANGVSSAVLAVQAPTRVPIAAASGVSSATLTVRTGAPITMTATGQSSATLVVRTGAPVPLAAASGQSSATLGVASPTSVALDAASGASSATLGTSAKTLIPLDAATGQSSATLRVTGGEGSAGQVAFHPWFDPGPVWEPSVETIP